jgi:hypothetical protein
MTTEQGFRFVTRALTISSLFWFASELLYLPTDIVGIMHHTRLLHLAREMDKYVSDETYWVRYYMELAAMRALMVALSICLAFYFYSGGAWLRKFFLIEAESPSAE